jgi:hypothetical protein
MLFVNEMGWSEFARIDAPSTLQLVVLFFIALVLMPVVMHLFSKILRFVFIVTAVLAPVYIMLPILR